MATAGWWEALYDDLLAEVFLAGTDPAELNATTTFLIDKLFLSPGDLVFDQCCGIGTVALALAARGLRLLGVDQSASYVCRAREAARHRGLAGCTFHQADAFTFVPEQRCAAAVNWRTGFGGAGKDETNRNMLARAYATLRPGGRFALDYQNVPYLLRHFQEVLVRRHRLPEGEVVLLRQSTPDLPRGILHQRWTWFLPDGRRREGLSAVRLYAPHELARLLVECGFEEPAFFGGVRGEPLGLDSPRCIVLARRPDA
jgi:SAM-dependent methyltransferase